MRNLKLITALLVLSFAGACSIQAKNRTIKASSTYAERTIDGQSFSSVVINGSHTVEYRQSTDGSSSVTYSFPENLADHLNVGISGGRLTVSYKNNTNVKGESRIRVTATSPSLNAVTIAGSGKFNVSDFVSVKSIDVKISGSGMFSADRMECTRGFNGTLSGSGLIETNRMETPEFYAAIAGSGRVRAGGTSRITTAKLSGSGTMDLASLESGDLKATLSGSGRVWCHATASAEASLAGSGTIKVSGKAEDARLTLSGSGTINGSDLESANTTARISGSGRIWCRAARSANLTVASSGRIEASGTADHADLRISGSGVIEATNLVSEDVKASISGSGVVRCHAARVLDATVNGSGSVRYGGNPSEVRKQGKDSNIIKM